MSHGTAPRALTEPRIALAVFLLSLVLNLALSVVGFRNSPMEVHEFRQMQTALTTRAIRETGVSLAYPTPLFGPPWSVPMEFPIYEVVAAKVSAWTGLSVEVAARAVSLAFFYLSLPACFGLAGLLGIPRPRRWLMLALLLLTPIYAYYSRTIMIESTALCGCCWFLFTYLRALHRGANRWLLAAIGFGVFAAVAKVTTFIVFLTVAALSTAALLVRQWRASANRLAEVRSTVVRAFAATIPAVLLGTAWVRYSDRIKNSNPLSTFLASGPMGLFNFGTLAQRGSMEFWHRVASSTAAAVVMSFNLALIVVFALGTSRAVRHRSLLLLAGFLAGPVIFANLYFVHDYYYYANSIFLLGVLGLAWSQLLDNPALSPVARWSLVLLSLGIQGFTYIQSYFTVQQRAMDQAPEVASALAAATRPDDILLIFGRDWDPKISYFSHRRAVMVTDARNADTAALSAVLDRIEPGKVAALVVTGELRQYPDFVKPLIARLKLHRDALLVSSDTTIYVSEARFAFALERLAVLPLKTFNFTTPLDVAGTTMIRLRFFPAAIQTHHATAMMNPQPSCILHPFGLASHGLQGHEVFNAHAPTDVIFELPANATAARAEFGILPSAYTGKNSTEGVEFRIEHVDSTGTRRTLRTIYLNPSKFDADRGTKELAVQLPPGLTGQIWFRTLPGPTGSITCAWAYWQRISVR